MGGTSVLDDLDARGLLHDTTDRQQMAHRLGEGPAGVYYGIDPTADSLHLGNLIGVLVLRRFQQDGHRPIALVGGATGMIGDPSGRSDERNLLDEPTLAANLAGIRSQLEGLLDLGTNGGTLVNNHDWTRNVTLLEFLRDVGKHTTVNQMIARQSIRSRLEGDTGISFTEFSYMLLQAFDFWWLHTQHNCEMQIGGSDQWGNIVAGIDLIRRRESSEAHGLTWPLLTRSDGAKFGKTAEGAIWLDPRRTSPYRFHQYFVQLPDADVERALLQFTMLGVSDIHELLTAHAADPSRRQAQHVLADEVTTLVHGPDAAAAARAAAAVLFGAPPEEVDAAAFEAIAADVPTSDVPATRLAAGLDLLELLVDTGLATSKGDARRGLAEGSIYVNNHRHSAEDTQLNDTSLLHGRYLLLRRGKRRHHLIRSLP